MVDGFAPLRALGMMSGTSMDGVDAAVIETDGETIAGFGPSAALAYAAEETALLRANLGWTPSEEAKRFVTEVHIRAARMVEGYDVVGFHGQTVAHDPGHGRTLQIGDGAALARALGKTVVWDFRSADMAAGGEGAPLAPFFHFALARRMGAEAPLAILNLGGVGNVTWIDPAAEAPEAPGAMLAFDTGPGNALIDDFMLARTGTASDVDGKAALAGRPRRIEAGGDYLTRRPPKSLDRDDFRAALAAVEGMSVEDGAASLAAFTADCVAAGLAHMPAPPTRWLVCGGGRRNPALMAMLAERLAAPVEPVEAAGSDGDMLEAQAFGFLAVRALRGLPLSAPGTTGCARPVAGGRISRP